MRGKILGTAILAASVAFLGSAQAGEPTGGSWRPPPPRTANPPTPRPVVSPPVSRPITTRPVVTPARTPPVYPPLSVKIVKPPNYNKRTMALIQQNIAMQAAMRNTQGSTWAPRCKSSWDEAKLHRKGCLAAPPQPEPEPERQLSPAMIADARLCASAVDGADCGAVQAARDRVANGAPGGGWQN